MHARPRRTSTRLARLILGAIGLAASVIPGGRGPAHAGSFTPITFFETQYLDTMGDYAGETIALARAAFEIDPAQFGGTAQSLDGSWYCFQANAAGSPLFFPPPPTERLHQAYDFCRGASGTLEYCDAQPAGRIGFMFFTCFTIVGDGDPAACLANMQAQMGSFSFKARKASQAEINAHQCTGPPQASFTASATAAPAEVQLEDENATITVTVTLENTGGDALTNVAATADPTLSGGGLAEKTAGPTPASVDLAPGASATVTYTYAPTKGGPVTFSFASFGAQSSGGPIEVAGPVETNQVLIKEDVSIEVKLEPATLTTDSRATSGGLVRVKVTNAAGEPSAGRRVRLEFPQYYLGPIDFEPRVLICPSDGTLAYPPGANPIPLDAAFATTPASGEVTFQLWVGTQRRSAELLVTADAIEENGDLLATDSERFALADGGSGAVSSGLLAKLNEAQTNQLPEAQRLDEAGVTGRGTPLEVLQSVVRWLGVERERGASYLQGIDFVPITSQDQTNAGVLFYNRGELQAMIARLQGTVTAVNAFVLQIEVGQLDPLGRHRVVWVTDFGGMMPLETWVTTRPLNALGLEDQGKPIRGAAVPAVSLVSSSQYAYLGFPYPAAGSPAAGSYGGGCVPALGGTVGALHSPVSMLVKDAAGNALGHDPAGAYVNDVAGAAYAAGEPALYLLPPGAYQAELLGTGKGPATLVLSSPAGARTFTFKAKPGKTGTVTFDDTLVSATGTFNRKKLKVADGVPITVTGVKKKVKIRSGDPLTLTVTNPFGGPVAGARVHATGNAFDAETLTGADGVATMPLVVTKATKKLTVTIDGAGVQPRTLKLKVKLLK